MNEASEMPQGQGPERPPLREISQDELEKVLETHWDWLRSKGEEGQKANLARFNLQEKNLQNAILFEANLQGADLANANLQGANLALTNLQEAILRNGKLQKAVLADADLRDADLSSANLEEANLNQSDLRGAVLKDARLFDTVLRNARLQDADLTDVSGLRAEKLAGTDVSHAKLPEAILKFEGLKIVEETSRNGRKVFYSMLLACVYALFTIAATTDARLLTNSASSSLPVIGTKIPIVWFYFGAPVLLFFIYLYLHLYLQGLWPVLATLPAIFPEGRRLDERAYPWLLNRLVVPHSERLRDNRPPLSRFTLGGAIFFAWYFLPLTLLLFWGRYLDQHDWVGTGLHVLLLGGSIGLGVYFHRLARVTLRGDSWIAWKTVFRDGAVVIVIWLIFYGLSVGAIEGVPPDLYSPVPSPRAPNLKSTNIRRLVPLAFSLIGYSPFADFTEKDVSAKPPNWTGQAAEEVMSVKGASLKDRNLRYAKAFKAFLVNADLRLANLHGAHLWAADLRWADLGGADVQEAELIEANLQGANLQGADLRRAGLVMINLQDADLRGADLEGADLVLANLHGAELMLANLHGADLREAVGFTASQVKAAKNWDLAFYSDDFLKELDLQPDHNKRVEERLAELEKEKKAIATKP